MLFFWLVFSCFLSFFVVLSSVDEKNKSDDCQDHGHGKKSGRKSPKKSVKLSSKKATTVDSDDDDL